MAVESKGDLGLEWAPEPLTLSFDGFVAEIHEELVVVKRELSERLSDNPSILNEQVRKIEAWYGRMTTLLAYANSYLDVAKSECLPARERGRTDLDRETELDRATSLQRRLRDEVQGVVDAIQLRVSLTQSIMRANNAEGRMGT